jgi:5-methylcytosine-specific restriction protein A
MQKRTRGYTWQKIRNRILADNPLCVHCLAKGITTLAKEIDHVKPLHLGGTDDDDNLMPLCKECHSIKTAKDMGYDYKPKVTIGIDGWIV